MSIGVLLVEINNRQAGLVYNTKKWELTLRYNDSPTFEFEMSMDNIKRIYKTSSYTETHLEDKNKLARTNYWWRFAWCNWCNNWCRFWRRNERGC